MDAQFWLYSAMTMLGVVLVTLGLLAVLEIRPIKPAEFGQGVLALGLANVIQGTIYFRSISSSDWVGLSAPALYFAGAFLLWRSVKLSRGTGSAT